MVVSLAVLIPSSTVHAEGASVGVKVGTLGIGPEIGVSFSKYFGARFGFNYLPFSYSDTINDTRYDFDLNLQSVSAILDFHPFRNSFRLSGGFFYNGNNLDASAKSTSGSYKVGNHRYPAALVGRLKGDIDFNSFAPYCGLGIDTTFGRDKSFGLTLELGVLFQGSPDVDLTADGPLSNVNAFRRDLEREENDIEDDLDKFQFYPVISVGMSYRF